MGKKSIVIGFYSIPFCIYAFEIFEIPFLFNEAKIFIYVYNNSGVAPKK